MTGLSKQKGRSEQMARRLTRGSRRRGNDAAASGGTRCMEIKGRLQASDFIWHANVRPASAPTHRSRLSWSSYRDLGRSSYLDGGGA